jgi:hypothetical protein
MAESNIPFVILIDTNAMAALSLYVDSCDTVGKALAISIDDLKIEFENQKDIKKDCLNFDEIEKGYKLYYHLKEKIGESDENIQIWFSLLSEIELLNVFLDRTFDHELTKKGIPYRIRHKKPFRTQINFNYEKKVANYWENMEGRLAESDIGFNYPEKEEGAIRDIIEIAKIVTRYVALGPVDLYLYASGIYLRADEIYTIDGEFRDIINKIRTDGGWGTVYRNIQQDLIKFIWSFEDEYQKIGKIDLPKGFKQGRTK